MKGRRVIAQFQDSVLLEFSFVFILLFMYLKFSILTSWKRQIQNI